MPSRLEKARGRFIGRDSELASLGDALSKARIVSIVGPGGVGKTRLAGEYFERADIEPVFIWLDELRSPDEIGSRLVDALGLPGAGEDNLERAAAALSGSRRVVFFDNAEHVLEGVARVAHRLDTQIVVTSRAPLGLSGEHVVVVEPLSPNHALKLFEDRAGRLGVDATLDGVDELVAALDALPLAIELAAARSTVLSPRQILARLRDSNRVIGSAGGDRQSTLDDTIRWSWDLLEPAERDIIITISLFDHPVEPGVLESLWPTHDVLAVAAALEARSWLRVVETTPSSKRWSTLWAMRRFVREQIDDETRTHHLDRLVEWTRLHLEESPSWWTAYLPEALVAARTLQQRGEAVSALTVLSKLFHSAWTGPHLSAVLEQTFEALNRVEPAEYPELWAMSAVRFSKTAFRYRGRYRAKKWSAAAADVAPEGTVISLAANAQHVVCLVDDGCREEAHALFEQVVAHPATMKSNAMVASVVLDLAIAAHEMGRFEDVRGLCERVVAIGRAIGRVDIEAPPWIHLAYASYDLGEFERAQDELAHLEVLMADRPPQERQLTVGAMPAFIELQRGNDDRAHELLLAAKEAAVEWGNGPVEFYALLGLAEWAARNEPEAAPQYLEQAHAVVALHSAKSAAQSRFLLALYDLASGNFHAAMDRLTYLRASERAPARPQDWNAALDATIWLASKLAGGSDAPPPPSNLGSLMAAVLAAVRGRPEELDALLDDRPPSTWTIPGLYLLRIDDVARRLATALASSIVLRLEPQARRIQIGDSEIIDMSRRAAGRRILDHLAAVHDATPGAPVDVNDLIGVGWPDELILHDAALSRVYTTMNRLRGLGLSEILITIDDGYALARALRVERVDQL